MRRGANANAKNEFGPLNELNWVALHSKLNITSYISPFNTSGEKSLVLYAKQAMQDDHKELAHDNNVVAKRSRSVEFDSWKGMPTQVKLKCDSLSPLLFAGMLSGTMQARIR